MPLVAGTPSVVVAAESVGLAQPFHDTAAVRSRLAQHRSLSRLSLPVSRMSSTT